MRLWMADLGGYAFSRLDFFFFGGEGQKVLYPECIGIPGADKADSPSFPGIYLGSGRKRVGWTLNPASCHLCIMSL